MATATVAATGKTVTFNLPESDTVSPRAGVSLPKTPHPKKFQEPGASPGDVMQPPLVETVRPQSVPERRLSPRAGDDAPRPLSRPSSEQNGVSLDMKQRTKPAHSYRSRQRREDHVGKTHKRVKPSDAARVITTVRERTNSASREDMRLLKYNVAKLREHHLKVEEEIKHLTRGKSTLELAVQDIRKAISVNQQSVSMQQKKTHLETVSYIIHACLYMYLVPMCSLCNLFFKTQGVPITLKDPSKCLQFRMLCMKTPVQCHAYAMQYLYRTLQCAY